MEIEKFNNQAVLERNKCMRFCIERRFKYSIVAKKFNGREILTRREKIKKKAMIQRRRYNCSLKVA